MIRDILWIAVAMALTVIVIIQAHSTIIQADKHKQYLACMKSHVNMIISDETFDYWDSFCMKQARNK